MKTRQEMEHNSSSSSKEDKYLGVALVHSQVKKIKQEMEKIKEQPELQQPEVRPVVHREIFRQKQRSRSPLGLAQRPISVGNS